MYSFISDLSKIERPDTCESLSSGKINVSSWMSSSLKKKFRMIKEHAYNIWLEEHNTSISYALNTFACHRRFAALIGG